MTKKHTRLTLHGLRAGFFPAAMAFSGSLVVSASLILPVGAHAQQQRPNYPVPGSGFLTPEALQLPPMPTQQAITPNGQVVEGVAARVNDQIITRSEYQRAEQGLLQEAQQQNLTQSQLDDRVNNLLRDMIDKQLLISKGKELGINCDADVIRQLDDIRKQNHLDSMEALEKAAQQQGISFEDFKQQIRESCITQKVVSEEVGRRINMTHSMEDAYYSAHLSDFAVPEQVHLSEILIPTPDNATDAQLAAAKAKADAVEQQLKGGASFAQLAKTESGGPTASAGGDLGDFKRGALGDILEKASFSLPVGGNTEPIRTRQGYVILHVDSHQQAGTPPLSAIEPQVQQAIYVEQLQPALRAYLTKARDEAYIDIAPGFVDSGSPRKSTRPADIAYTAYSAPAVKKKVLAKQRLEQEKAEKARQQVAEARAKFAEKQAEKGGKKDVNAKGKKVKIHREKIRFGQAPENALPAGDVTAKNGAPLQGQAPGVAMAPTESVTSITTGVGADDTENPLENTGIATKGKTRFSARETESEIAAAKAKLTKAELKASARPVQTTPQQSVAEKVQAAPLGLNGDTAKKKKEKKKRVKGEKKERMQDQQAKPVVETKPVAPTVNPDLAAPTPTTPPPATQNPPQR
jgi:peptidyl-prolyl cis-trans isomerase SurA